MKQKTLIAAGLAAALLLSGCGGQTTTEETADTAPTGTAVEVQTVERTDLANENTVSGQIIADSAVSVVPTVSGTVKSLNVAAGDYVTAGQVLFTIDTSLVTSSYGALQQSYSATRDLTDQAIATAQAAVPLARTAVDTAQQNYDNTLALFNIGAASQLAVDQAYSQLQQAQSQLTQAEAAVAQAQASQQAQLAQIQSSLDQIGAQAAGGTVKAPCDGLVTAVNITEGSMAGQTGPALTIAEGGRTRISVQVSETLLGQLAVGDVATVTVAAASPEPFAASIASIAPASNAQTSLYEVRLYTPDTMTFPIGAFADVIFYSNRRTDTVSIPTEAILTDGASSYVFVAEGDTCRRVDVQTGIAGDGVTEITAGLTGGEQLIVTGQSYLADGAAIRIVSGEDAS